MSTIGQLIVAPLLWRDRALSQHVSRWRPPRWVRIWMIAATKGGDGSLWWGVGLVVAGCGGPQRWLALASAALAAAGAVGSFMGLKRLTRRTRPVRLTAYCWTTVRAGDEFSFPSGHTLTAFAISTTLLAWYPEQAPLLLFIALSVAVSRLVLGLHFLTDIVAGAVLGTLLGYGCVLLLR